jgi:hypothetical protein
VPNTKTSMFIIHLLSTFFLLQPCHGFSHPSHNPSVSISAISTSATEATEATEASTSSTTTTTTTTNRRSFLSLPSLLILPAATIAMTVDPKDANAIKPKNDALCGTGFFEHIYEFKCTAIGDIEDEGSSKKMDSNEVGISDGLMGKLGLPSEATSTSSLSEEVSNESKMKTKRNQGNK